MYVEGSGYNYVMLTLYVVNLLITRPNDNTVAKVHKTLIDKFTVAYFGDSTRIVRIDIIQDKEHGTISISQAPHVLSLLDKYDIADCNLVHTPGIGNGLTADPEGHRAFNKEDTIEYRNIMGPLIFFY